MKKFTRIACALLVGMLSSCSNEDVQESSLTERHEVVETSNFTVIDENEVTEEQLFDNAVSAVKDEAAAAQLGKLKAAFKDSFAG